MLPTFIKTPFATACFDISGTRGASLLDRCWLHLDARSRGSCARRCCSRAGVTFDITTSRVIHRGSERGPCKHLSSICLFSNRCRTRWDVAVT